MHQTPELIELPALEHVVDCSPLTVTPDTLVIDVISLMSQAQGASCVLIVEETRVVGGFTEGDVVRLVVAGIDFSATTIALCMAPVVTLKQSEAESLLCALSLCLQHQIHYLPILNDDEQLVGIVTLTKLLQALDPVKTFADIAIQQQQQLTQTQTNEELQVALEEVQIIEEELRQQNEELVNTRQQIELERQRYQDLFEFAPDGYLVTDVTGNIQQANQAAGTLLSVRQNRLVGKPLVVFIAKSERQNFRTRLTQLQPRQEWEVYLQPRLGTPIPVAIAVTSVYDSQNQLVCLRWLIRDITFRKQMEQSLQAYQDNLERLVAQRTEELTRNYTLLQQEIHSRQLKEVELRNSEARFRQIAENINEVFFICAVGATQIFYISPAYEKIWGRTCESLYQNPLSWLEAIHPDDYERVRAALNKEIYGEQLQEEYRIIRPNGEIRWIFDRSFIVQDETGQILHVVGLAEDITERKQAEAALRESEARFRTMADSAPVMIWVKGTDKFCQYCNQGWLEFTGSTQEQESGYGWTKHIHPEDLQRCLDTYFTAFDARQPFTMEYRLQRFDGKYRWILDTGTPRYNADGSFAGYIGSCIDITEREISEQKIREQAALLNVTTDAILVQDLENKILFYNQSAEQLYGWKVDEAMGKNALELLYKSTPKLEEALHTVTSKGEWQGELSQGCQDGQEIIVASRWTLVRDRFGQPKSILTVNTDITEKKQLEAQLFRIQRLESLGTLASGIAHDLNNILTPTLITAQLLQNKISDVHNQRLLGIVESNAKRGASLVKQVLSFAHGVPGERTTLQIQHIIIEIERIVKETFPKSIEFYTDVASNLWTISGDTTQLHQVLMNLVVNARDAMPKGGSMRISAENFLIDEHYARMNVEATVGYYIVVTVTDTGRGISSEIIDRIFDPFFTTKEFGQGTGLGLSTVMGIVKSHGGFVTVKSEVGKGSQFQVYLPAINGMEPRQTKEEMELPKGNGELIFVVDDEAYLRETTKTLLETYNYKVLTATDGIEAIIVYAQQKNQISLVLMDMMMPNMDGATTISTLHKMNSQVKIIAASGLPSKDQVTQDSRVKIKAFLSKPYTLRELLNTIKGVLRAS